MTTELGGDSDVNGSQNGFHLQWSRLEKSVEVKDATSGLLRSSIAPAAGRNSSFYKKNPTFTKRILNEVSGYAAPGEVLSLMGPSGSGKTSLLNVLSGRSSFESGVIAINGEKLNSSSMKRMMSKIAYVKQSDIFFGHLTVRDQLTYTALLRLPSSLPKADKHREVDRIVKMLRLSKVADSPIKLLSGGEKKRVNIGSELLTDPMVLLLDEPTSGLDSTSAVSLLRVLQGLAQENGKTVITSIHQPSSAVFRSFDRLILLADGCTVYFGTPSASLGYLRDKGLACPDGYNAADHWMDLLVVDSSIEEEKEEADSDETDDLGVTERTDSLGQASIESGEELAPSASTLRRRRLSDSPPQVRSSPRLQLIEAWDAESVAEGNDLSVKDDDEASENPGGSFAEVKKYNTDWMTQFRVLTHRSLKNSRSAIFTPINLIKSAVLGLIAGLVWFQQDYTESTVYDRSAYYFFTMTYWVFDSMFNALLTFPLERTVILKERASASYQLSAYFMAKTMSEAPTRLVLPFIYMCISFWLAGLSSSFAVFLASTFCTLLSVLAGESLGLLIGASIYNMEKAMMVMTVCALALMLLGGFFVDNIPSFLEWGKYLSPFKYSYDASLQFVFDKDVPCDGSGALEQLCGGADTGYATADEVLDFLGVQGSVGFNVGMLFVIISVPRYVAYLALRSKKGGDRS